MVAVANVPVQSSCAGLHASSVKEDLGSGRFTRGKFDAVRWALRHHERLRTPGG